MVTLGQLLDRKGHGAFAVTPQAAVIEAVKAMADKHVGALLVMEEETSIDALPAAAKASILKKVGDGKLGLVEVVTASGKPAVFEAAYTNKKGKKLAVLVGSDGVEVKN